MRQLVNATDEQVEKMRDAVRVFFLNKRVDWVEANRVFAEAERERERRGEPSLIAMLSNAYYDVLDDDGDGTVDVDELKTMMKAFDVPRRLLIPSSRRLTPTEVENSS